MKMKLFDKFLLAIVLLLLLAVSVFIGLVTAGAVSYAGIIGYLSGLGIFSSDFSAPAIGGLSDVNRLIFGGVALLLFVVVIRLFFASYRGDKSQGYTRLSTTENGVIAISVPTIRQIASAFIATKPDVAACQPSVLPAKDGIAVNLRICVKEGSVLPDVTQAVQKELKAHLESITGLVVKDVHVYVDNNRSSYSGKAR